MTSHTIHCVAVLLLASTWMSSLCSSLPEGWKEIHVEQAGVDNHTCWSHGTLDSTSVVPCRTLLYAFGHVESHTRIRIGCGTHTLEPLNSDIQVSPFTRLEGIHIHIQGYCIGSSMLPVVQCVNGSHLAFKEAEAITVEGLRFHNCRGIQREVGKNTGVKFYSVYFDRCSYVTIRDVELILTDNGDGIGCNMPLTSVHLSNIYVLQMNGWGNAISMAFSCRNLACKTTTSITNVGILRQGYNLPQSATPPNDYYGILILVYTGTHILEVSDVAILDSGVYHSSAGRVSVTVHTEKTIITLENISVVSGWQRKLATASKPISQTPLFCEENSTIISKEPTEHNVATNSAISAGIQIQVNIEAKKRSKVNFITVEHSLVSHCRIWPSFGATVPPKLWHWSYEQIVNHTYNSQSLNTLVTPPSRRVGLSVMFAEEYSPQNSISVTTSVFAYNSGKLGGGISVNFSQHSFQNSIDIQQTAVAFNWAESGGGVFINYQSISSRNKATFRKGHIIGNRAMDYGAGMCLMLQEETSLNRVYITQANIVHNVLLQSNEYAQERMGGGVHIGFDTSSIKMNMVRVLRSAFFHNQAVGAREVDCQCILKRVMSTS